MTKPVVAHFVRGFLRPTETFIMNQITTLQHYEPKVFCHHEIDNYVLENILPTVILDILPPFLRSVEKYSYSISRHLSPLSINRIIKEIELAEPKLFHFHYLVDARFFLQIAKKMKLPSVVSGYGWDVSSFPKMKLGYGKFYLQPIFKTMDIFLAMSEDMKSDMIKLGCPEQKIIIHYHGSDVKRFEYPSRRYDNQEKINLLFCGRLVDKKAPQDILFALHLLEKTHNPLPPWTLTYVGDGPLREELEILVENFQWHDKVIFTGHIPYHSNELVNEYKKADIYLQPSKTVRGEKEGIPGTLIEAMASGLPVISTNHAGIPCVIDNNVNGILVDEGDIQGLSQVLLNLLLNVEDRKKLGMAARTKAIRKLNLYEGTKQLEEIYDAMVK